MMISSACITPLWWERNTWAAHVASNGDAGCCFVTRSGANLSLLFVLRHVFLLYSRYSHRQQNVNRSIVLLSVLRLLVKERPAPPPPPRSNLEWSGLLIPGSSLLQGKQGKQGGRRKKCLIPSFPLSWVSLLNFSSISMLSNCILRPEAVWKREEKKKNNIQIQHHAVRKTACRECFSSLFHSQKQTTKKESVRQAGGHEAR